MRNSSPAKISWKLRRRSPKCNSIVLRILPSAIVPRAESCTDSRNVHQVGQSSPWNLSLDRMVKGNDQFFSRTIFQPFLQNLARHDLAGLSTNYPTECSHFREVQVKFRAELFALPRRSEVCWFHASCKPCGHSRSLRKRAPFDAMPRNDGEQKR